MNEEQFDRAWAYLGDQIVELKRNMKSSDERYRTGYTCALSIVQGLMIEAEGEYDGHLCKR